MINQNIRFMFLSVLICVSITGCNLGNNGETKSSPTTPQISTSTPVVTPSPTSKMEQTTEVLINNPQFPTPDKIELILNNQSNVYKKEDAEYNKLFNAVETMISKSEANNDLLMDPIGIIETFDKYKKSSIIYHFGASTALKFKKLNTNAYSVLFPISRDRTISPSVAFTLKEDGTYKGPISFPQNGSAKEDSLRNAVEDISGQKITE